MRISDTPSRLKEIMKLEDLRQVDIIEKAKLFSKELGVNLSRSDLSQYVTGRNLPSQDKLYLLAKTLDVTEPWLMGYDVPMRANKKADHEDKKIEQKVKLDYNDNGDLMITVKNEDSKITKLLNKLNEDGKKEALKRIEELSFIPRFTK